MSAALELRGIGLTYATRRGNIHALADVDLQVKSGEFVALLGPSGCGKSTILKLATGLMSATCGQVQVAAQDVTGPGQQTGWCFRNRTCCRGKRYWRTCCSLHALSGYQMHRPEVVPANYWLWSGWLILLMIIPLSCQAGCSSVSVSPGCCCPTPNCC
ncbi:Aliphatic sulfonates import ATP-binding protein SsuB [Raoultella terrigena]|uniref:Aliphatic sulfonates import ATP-binding protein SsuB n=1 Tax=Raoultella terrigena TaxID=577 RepID=A0A3P8KIT8_RAOTE|nr:Aliphatic sulfonates import ATP-binding protein SsuB [Raoultella terrigena]